MRTSLRVVPVLLSLLLCALLASPAQAVTPQEQLGSHCVDVHSAQNWEGTICVIVNLSDATGDTFAQALITFQVRSGTIYEVWVNGGLYLRYCQNNGSGCGNQNYEQSPYKIPPGNVNSTFRQVGTERLVKPAGVDGELGAAVR